MPDPYFSSASSSCSIGVSAVVDFGTSDPLGVVGAGVTAVIGGATNKLDYNATNGRWESTGNNFFSIASGVGPLPVELKWTETKGTVTGQGLQERQQRLQGHVRHGPARLQRE